MKLFSKVPNTRGILRSKAASEGPMVLSLSVFFAVRNALQSARADARSDLTTENTNGHRSDYNKVFRFDSPATPEHILFSFFFFQNKNFIP